MRHLTTLRAALHARRDALVAAVHKHLPGCTLARVPAGGLHLWLRLPDAADDMEIVARAARAGVLVEAGSTHFVAEPPATHLRLTYAAGNPDQLLEGARRLASVLDLPH